MNLEGKPDLAGIIDSEIANISWWRFINWDDKNLLNRIIAKINQFGNMRHYDIQANNLAVSRGSYEKAGITAFLIETAVAFATAYAIPNQYRLYVLGAYLLVGAITMLFASSSRDQKKFYKRLADSLQTLTNI